MEQGNWLIRQHYHLNFHLPLSLPLHVCQAQYLLSSGNVGGPYIRLGNETLAFSKPMRWCTSLAWPTNELLALQANFGWTHTKLVFSSWHKFKAFGCSSSLWTRNSSYSSLLEHFTKSHNKTVPHSLLCHVVCLWVERNDGRPTQWWLQAAILCHHSFLSMQLKNANDHGMLVTPKSLVAFAVFVLVRGNCPTLFMMDFSFYKYFFNKICSAGKNQPLGIKIDEVH